MDSIKTFILKQWERVRNNSFVKSVLTLSAGVVVSQSIALLTTPIISRIYDPEVLGDFAIITSNATIIGVVVCLGLLSAIMIPKENDEAKGLCRLVTVCIIGLTTVLLLIALMVSDTWKMFSVNLDYRIACLILWFFVVLTNVSNVLYAYVNRQKKYRVLFWNPTIGTVSNAAISICLGLLDCGLWGYACGNLMALVLNIIHMLAHANPYQGKIEKKYSAKPLLKTHKDFTLVLLPSNIISSFVQQMPVQMLSRFWGNIVLGSYSMCLTILGLPTKFIAGPVNRVFYREATERANRGEDIGQFTLKILKANIKIAIIPLSILIVFGAPLFTFVLGEKWEMAGAFASILGVQQLMTFCNSCLAGKFVVINRKKTILILNCIGVVIYFMVFLFCHLAGFDAMTTIVSYAVVGVLFEITDATVFMIQCKANMKEFLRFLLLYFLVPVTVATLIRIFILGNVL